MVTLAVMLAAPLTARALGWNPGQLLCMDAVGAKRDSLGLCPMQDFATVREQELLCILRKQMSVYE